MSSCQANAQHTQKKSFTSLYQNNHQPCLASFAKRIYFESRLFFISRQRLWTSSSTFSSFSVEKSRWKILMLLISLGILKGPRKLGWVLWVWESHILLVCFSDSLIWRLDYYSPVLKWRWLGFVKMALGQRKWHVWAGAAGAWSSQGRERRNELEYIFQRSSSSSSSP